PPSVIGGGVQARQADRDVQGEAHRPPVAGRGHRHIDGLLLPGRQGADVDWRVRPGRRDGGGRLVPFLAQVQRFVEIERLLDRRRRLGSHGAQRRPRRGGARRRSGGCRRRRGADRLFLQLLQEVLPQVDGAVLRLLEARQVDLVAQVEDLFVGGRGGGRGARARGWRGRRRRADGAAGGGRERGLQGLHLLQIESALLEVRLMGGRRGRARRGGGDGERGSGGARRRSGPWRGDR